MKYIVFNDELTPESLNKLMSEITDDIVIYFDSKGGDYDSTRYFIDFTKRTEHKITLISNWRLASSAFDLFFMSNTEKIVMESCFGIVHLVNRDINTTDLKKMDDLNTFLMNNIETTNKDRWEYYLKLGMNENNFNKYDNGYDIIISNENMKRFATKAKELLEESK
ncbi:MAG: hypothetical protein ABFC34_04850 [Methanobacterium sp.]